MKKNRCSQEDHCCLGSPSKKDAEKPPGPYWGELPRSPVKSPPKVHNPPGQEPSIYISRDRRSVIKLRPLPPPPPGPSAPMPRPRPSPATPTPRGKAMARPSSPVRSGALHNTETWVPPETWGYTNRQLKPTKKGSRGKDRAHASSSNNRHIVSRFCNRRKALNRPIELEEAPPAIGETHESIRTVKELLPYQDQFRAAGLAVTSKEQKAYHRRGKLAPLLGKMPPAIEWLRLDGGTETHEMVIEDKKDDSPSPINVEQISQKSGEDKLYSASNGLPSPDRQSNQTVSDEEKENIQPPPVPKLQGGIPDLDKTLPALPRVFSQVLVRHGSGPSRNSSWSAAMRQFPPPIVEQKELEGSPPDKQQQQQQHKKRHQQDTTTTPSIKSATTSYGTAVIQPAKRYGQLQIQNTKQDSVITTKTPPHPSVVSSSIIELPMSKSVRSGRTIRTGTPSSSSLEKALDEAVRRLQAMGETVVVATPSTAKSKKSSSPKSKSKATTGKGKHQRWTTSSSKTVPSPTQRLQMAKALRRDKMGSGATVAAVGDGGCSPRSKPTSPASTCTVKREEDIGSSPTNTVERAEKVGGMTASPTPTVEEATAVIIPRVPPSRVPPLPPRPGSRSVLASIEVLYSPPPVVSGSASKGPEGPESRAPLRITRPQPGGLDPKPELNPEVDPTAAAAFPLPPPRRESSNRPDLGNQPQARLRFRVSKRSSSRFISNQQRASTSNPRRTRSSSIQRPQRPPTRRQTSRPQPLARGSLFHSPFPPFAGYRDSSSSALKKSSRTSQRNSSQRNSHHPDRHLPASDILKGLHIMCAASADEDVDAWFRHKTGLRLRRFLADLRTFEEELGEEGAARRVAFGESKSKGKRRRKPKGPAEMPEIDDESGRRDSNERRGTSNFMSKGASHEGRDRKGKEGRDRKGKGKGKGIEKGKGKMCGERLEVVERRGMEGRVMMRGNQHMGTAEKLEMEIEEAAAGSTLSVV